MPDANQIEAALNRLAQIQFPELERPAIGEEEKPTFELIYWAAKMYCFSLLAHFREMLGSFLTLVHAGQIPAAFVIARCMFELAAHAYYTHKHARQYIDAGDLKSAWEFLVEINMGSRYIREEYGDQPKDWPPFAAPREIAKVIRVFNEWTEDKATTEYSFLSEFAHPNMAALSHYYEIEPAPSGFGTVTFIDPPRNAAEAPWSHISISLVACLEFALRLLESVGETAVAPELKTILIQATK